MELVQVSSSKLLATGSRLAQSETSSWTHGRARAFTSFKGVFALANYPKGLIKRQQLLFSALFAGCTGGRSLGGALRSSQSPCLQDAALFPLPFPYFTPHAPSPVPWAPRLSLGIWPGEIAVKSVVGGRICVL